MTQEPPASPRFWQTTALEDMSQAQWEALCDGCGRCCLIKLEDVEKSVTSPGRFLYTRAACKLLDCTTGRCRDYENRLASVPDCLVLTPQSLAAHKRWMPETCAYRRLAEGRDLPWWHPLKTGDRHSTQQAGHCVAGWAFSEEELASQEDLTDHIIAPFHERKETPLL